jgi:excinuclease UvrABC helicase subunit UvrB
MMKELGFCNGIENHPRILEGRPQGRTRLRLDFPEDMVVCRRSHQTVPQLGGMHGRPSKQPSSTSASGPVGARQPPLRFDEFGQN